MIESVTYRQIITKIYDYIRTHCNNIDSRYDSLSGIYKSGYTYTIYHYTTTNFSEGVKATVANPVSKVTAAQVYQDIVTFTTNKMNLPESSYDTPANGEAMVAFLNNIGIWFVKSVTYMMSNAQGAGLGTGGGTGATGGPVMVYISLGAPDSNDYRSFNINNTGELIYTSSDIQTLMNKCLNQWKQSMRVHPIKYNYSWY